MSKVTHEVRLARQALEQGDVRHAAHHAAAAICIDPTDADALALVDQLAFEPAPGFGAAMKRLFGGGDPVAPLFPEDGYAGNVAARARALWKRGDLQGAFDAVVSLGTGIDDRPFVGWALELVALATEREVVLDPHNYFSAYAELGRGTLGLLHLRPAERRYFAPWAELGARLIPMHIGGQHEDMLRLSTASLQRRAGQHAAALETLAPLGDRAPESALAARGLALRALGRWDEAIRAFERADAAARGEFSYACELARVRWDAGELEEARRLFARGAAGDREVEIAIEMLDELLDPERARYWTRVLGEGSTYDAVRRLAMGRELYALMSDASTNVLPQLSDPPPMKLTMATSCAESPSVLATLALRTLGTSDPRGLAYSTGDEPTPSPYQPLDATHGLRLWAKHGQVAVQTVDLPPPEVQTCVDALVRSLWARKEGAPPFLGLTRAWRAARELDGLDELDPMHLVATMVHPPPPDDWADTTAWVFDRQVVAAMLLAAQDAGTPWLRSRRRTSLRGLLLGHPDWTQAAALHALRQLVLDEPDALDDAREWAARLLDAQPDKGHVPWSSALRALLETPGMPARDASRVVALSDAEPDE